MSTPFRVRHGIIVETNNSNASVITSNNQVLSGSSETPIFDLATTWNTTGNPTAIRLNVTNTASGANSSLMNLQLGGASRFYVAANGNVGVGTNTPNTQLHVVSWSTTPMFESTFSGAPVYLRYRGSVGGPTTWDLGLLGDGSGDFKLKSHFGNTVPFVIENGAANNTFRIKYNTGYVGIGTTDPVSQFDVAGVITSKSGGGALPGVYIYGAYTDASNYERVKFTANATAHYVLGEEAGTGLARPLYLGSNNNVHMTIAANGNIGIGNTSPGSALDVSGIATFRVNPSRNITIQQSATTGQVELHFNNSDANASRIITNQHDLAILPNTGIVRIGSGLGGINGPLKIGILSTSTQYGLYGSTAWGLKSETNIPLAFESGVTDVNTDVFVFNQFNSGGRRLFNVISNTASRFMISSNGNVGISTTSPANLFEVDATTQPKTAVEIKSNSGSSQSYVLRLNRMRNDGLLVPPDGSANFDHTILRIDSASNLNYAYAQEIITAYKGETKVFYVRNDGYLNAPAARITDKLEVKVIYSDDGNSGGDHLLWVSAPQDRLLGLRNQLNFVSYGANTIVMGHASNTFGNFTFNFKANTTGTLSFLSNGSGNLSIGTLASTAKLTVSSGTLPTSQHIYGTYTDSSNYERINLTANTTGHYLLGEEVGTGLPRPLYLGANNATHMTIAANGNVGINASNPSEKLVIRGSTENNIIRLSLQNGGGTELLGIGAGADAIANVQSYGTLRLKSAVVGATLGPIYLNAGNTDVVTVAANGNVGIGTTAPANKLTVNAPSTATDASVLITKSGSGSTQGLVIQETTGFTIAPVMSVQSADGTNRFSVYGNGSFSATGASSIGGGGGLSISTGGTGNDLLRLVNVAVGGKQYNLGSTNDGAFTIYDNTAGLHRLFLNTNGNLGVGTTAPSKLFQVNGTTRLNWTATTGTPVFDNIGVQIAAEHNQGTTYLTSNTNATINFADLLTPTERLAAITYASKNININNVVSDGNIVLSTNNTERMRIANNGSVGIGTSSPDANSRIQVSGVATNNTNAIKITSIQGDNGSIRKGIDISTLGAPNGTYYGLYVNVTGHSTDWSIYAPNGKSYFGSNAEFGQTVSIRGTTDSNIGTLRIGDRTVSVGPGNGGKITFWGDDRGQGNDFIPFAGVKGIKENGSYLNSLGALVFETQSVSSFGAGTDLTEKMRISSGGNVGIGTNAPSVKLAVYSTENNWNSILSRNTGSVTPSNGILLLESRTTTGTGNTTNAFIEILGNNGSNARVVKIGIGVPDTYGSHDTGFINLGTGNMWNPPSGVYKWSSSGTTVGSGSNQYKGYEWYNNQSDNQNAFWFHHDITAGAGSSFKIYSAKTSNTNTAVLDVTSASGALFVIDNTGKVGIGTASPSYKLHLADGHMLVGGTNGIFFNNASSARIVFDQSQYRIHGIGSTVPIVFLTNDTERMRIANTGNVGIGVSNPLAKLHIEDTIVGTAVRTRVVNLDNTHSNSHTVLQIMSGGSVGGDPHIFFGVNGLGTSGWNLGLDNSDDDKFKISGPFGDIGGLGSADKFVIDASGNIGIGISAPTNKLEVVGPASFPYNVASFTDGTSRGVTIKTSTNGYTNMRLFDAGGRNITITSQPNDLTSSDNYLAAIATGLGGGVSLSTAVSSDNNHITLRARGDIAFFTNLGSTSLIERMRIASNGNIGIGTSSPSARLHVVYDGTDVNGTPGQYISGADRGSFAGFAATATGGKTWAIGSTSDTHSAGGGKFALTLLDTNSTKLVVDADGDLGINTTTPTAKLDVNSDVIRVRTAKTPASPSDTGNQGDICWDANYIYVCTATNTWVRASLGSW